VSALARAAAPSAVPARALMAISPDPLPFETLTSPRMASASSAPTTSAAFPSTSPPLIVEIS
jgi:hypothetical protein